MGELREERPAPWETREEGHFDWGERAEGRSWEEDEARQEIRRPKKIKAGGGGDKAGRSFSIFLISFFNRESRIF
jgi:hypothetical protein